MKKTFRLIAALLALCVLSATVPPVGLAAGGNIHTLTAGADLFAYLQDQPINDGDIIKCSGLISIASQQNASDDPWIINKSITIEGGQLSIYRGGILLGADVTFKDTVLTFTTPMHNAIIANGYNLTLDGVTASNSGYVFNVFCGTLLKNKSETFDVPTPGTGNTVTIQGNTDLRGGENGDANTNVVGACNIYAGSLALGAPGPNEDYDGTPNEFKGNPTIHVENHRSLSGTSPALGKIYAGGAQQRNPYNVNGQKPTTPDPEKYTVKGTVTVTGTNMLPDVDGAGADTTNVIYNASPNSTPTIAFENISSLNMEQGKLVLGEGTSLRDGQSLSVLSGAQMDISKLTSTIGDFTGGGSLILGQSQTVEITGAVSGKTTIGIGGIFSNASQTTPQENHSYIKAPNSQNDSFVLLPPTGSEMKLERNPDTGEWKVSGGSSGETVNRVTSFQIAPDDCTITMAEDAEIDMEATFETENQPFLDFIPLIIAVDGKDLVANENPDYPGSYIYKYQSGVLTMTVVDNALLITPDRQYSTGEYGISVTIPQKYNGTSGTLKDTFTLTVTDGNVTPPDPGVKIIPVPKANTGLQWTGEEQIGVSEGTGYTLTGHKGTGVGSYTATATLVSGYQWTDGSTASKTISWSIDKADGPSAPSGLAGGAPTAVGRSDGKITGTTGEMEYAGSASFSSAQSCGAGETTGLAAGTYYVRYQETATHKAGASVTVAVPAPSGGGSTGGGSTGGGSTGGGSSSGGSSGSSSGGSSSTVKNPDGSTTVTSVNKTAGTVTETTKRPDGSKTVVESKEDGTVTILDTLKDGSTIKTVDHPSGTVEIAIKQANGLTASVTTTLSSAQAEVRLPSKVIQGAEGDAIPLPIPALPVSSLSDAVADITIHTGTSRPVPVEIPAEGSVTTVAYLVGKDGAETMLKTAVLDDGQITINVPDGATVRLRDNVRSFDDTNGHWAEESIAFVTARELFVGESTSAFGPETPLTRAMLTTVLARLDGADTSGDAYGKGMAWAAAHGISDGQNPGGNATREQFVTMLYRYAGSPAPTGREFWFYDAGEISPYARDAVQWAVENGILSGYGDGSIAPSASTTRAQSASILARYVKYLNRK